MCLIDPEDESQPNRFPIQPSADGRDSRLTVADPNADAVTVLCVFDCLTGGKPAGAGRLVQLLRTPHH